MPLINSGLFSRQTLYLLILQFGGPFFCILLTNTSRHYGESKKIDQVYLQIMAFAFALTNGLFRIIWGFLIDHFRFKWLMLINLSFQLGVSLTLKIFSKY